MAFKGTPGTIADAFSTSFRQKKDQMQRDREFNQKMSEEQRQSGLLEHWKQKNYEMAVEKQRYYLDCCIHF